MQGRKRGSVAGAVAGRGLGGGKKMSEPAPRAAPAIPPTPRKQFWGQEFADAPCRGARQAFSEPPGAMITAPPAPVPGKSEIDFRLSSEGGQRFSLNWSQGRVQTYQKWQDEAKKAKRLERMILRNEAPAGLRFRRSPRQCDNIATHDRWARMPINRYSHPTVIPKSTRIPEFWENAGTES